MTPAKALFTFILFMASVVTVSAQVGTYSPYSRFGLGLINERVTAAQFGQGRMSSVWTNRFAINPDNAAANTMMYKSTFQLDGSGQLMTVENATSSAEYGLTSVDGINMVFKRDFGRGAISMGMNKFSSNGYEVIDSQNLQDIGDVDYTYMGTGGVNKANLGYGYRIMNKVTDRGLLQKSANPDTSVVHMFAVGLNMDYYFGQTSRIKKTNFNDLSFFNTRMTSKSFINDVTFSASFMGKFNLYKKFKNQKDVKQKLDFVLGGTYSFGKDLNTQFDEVTENIVSGSFESVLDTAFIMESVNGYTHMPSKLGLGAGFVLTNENDISWQVLAEYKIQDWSAYETSFSSVEENNMFRDSKEFAVALIYQPIKNTSRTDLLENIGATLGYRTKETYLMVGENGLEENAFSVGVSIPLLGSKTWSKINLGTEFGNRSIDGSTFVDESYTNFSLGISFSPHLRYRWFERKKYN